MTVQRVPIVEGDALRILSLLNEYKVPLEIDFVATTLGKADSDIQQTLERLARRGVIEVNGPTIRIRR